MSLIGDGQKRLPKDGDVGSGVKQGIGHLLASITLSSGLV